MDFNNLQGTFDAQDPHTGSAQRHVNPSHADRWRQMLKQWTPERIVDIVGLMIIAISLILIIANYQTVLDGLFFSFLFPLIKVLTRILAVAAGVLGIGGVTYLFVRRHRRRY